MGGIYGGDVDFLVVFDGGTNLKVVVEIGLDGDSAKFPKFHCQIGNQSLRITEEQRNSNFSIPKTPQQLGKEIHPNPTELMVKQLDIAGKGAVWARRKKVAMRATLGGKGWREVKEGVRSRRRRVKEGLDKLKN
ncbi:unnamed protein product [Fraxinus pennsylvanica]|uniref:Uncharacterized protein n=1 Tax=Fraxinus pennsylvanica TaxID=56036 RepID=A0AAD1YV11_9LAMI|nr:unnamed protein product [Fraxinus pennsylvanica]